MAESRGDPMLHWLAPQIRGIIPLDGFHVPRRLARTLRQEPFTVRVDSAFDAVIEACADPKGGRDETWINDTIVSLYGELFTMGHAHSVECWSGDKLVGGLYGISLGAAFFGESMFSRVTDASKIALVYLVARLRAGGYSLLDVQFLTAHLEKFGAIEVQRVAYNQLLRDAVSATGDFYSLAAGGAASEVLQLVTQTS